MRPDEFIRLTHRQYVNMCVGFKDNRLYHERLERSLQYNIVKGWADPKKFKMSIEQWWPIDGDRRMKVIIPTQEELKIFDQRFKALGKRHGQN